MTELTPLDSAHAAMEAAVGDDAARLRFYERLADSELFILLSAETNGDQIEPDLFEVEGVSYVLVFDRETRLTEFVGHVAPYAALSGRAIAAMLAQEQLGLGLNLEVAPSSILMPPEAFPFLLQVCPRATATSSRWPSLVPLVPLAPEAPVSSGGQGPGLGPTYWLFVPPLSGSCWRMAGGDRV